MKKILMAAAVCATATFPALAQVGVSVSIGEPGFFGQIDIGGGAPPPQVIYPQPVIIQQAPVAVAPIYLRVPPGYERDWVHHCHEYNACGRPVYFVQHDWYTNTYAPHYRAQHPEHFAPPPRVEERGHGEREHERDERERRD